METGAQSRTLSEGGKITIKWTFCESYGLTGILYMAFHVCKPLPEIQHWIDRCRGRHWPPVQLLEAARVAPSFWYLPVIRTVITSVKNGDCLQTFIERMLMFSFNMTQIKCYIVLKLIKESLFNKMIGDCITSFHCKTLMFYTIERTHPSPWKEHNLMFLLLLMFTSIKEMAAIGKIPSLYHIRSELVRWETVYSATETPFTVCGLHDKEQLTRFILYRYR